MTHEFAIVPKALALDRSVSAEAVCLYAAIEAWMPKKKDGWRHIYRSQLGEALGIKENQVSKLTAQLCAAGWLHKEGDGGRNRPARYRPLQEKASPSQGRVLEANPIQNGSGQSVDIPELPAYDAGSSLAVWCAHCHCWHTHGRDAGGSEGYGHRAAHCHKPDSPYDRTGYFLRYIGPATDEVLRDMKRRCPRGVEANS
jgi:hypothetical protein